MENKIEILKRKAQREKYLEGFYNSLTDAQLVERYKTLCMNIDKNKMLFMMDSWVKEKEIMEKVGAGREGLAEVFGSRKDAEAQRGILSKSQAQFEREGRMGISIMDGDNGGLSYNRVEFFDNPAIY